MNHDAASLARMLAERIQTLARELLPTGFRNGPHWRCGNVAGEKGQSLVIHLTGYRAGGWYDYGDEAPAYGKSGDALDLVAAVLFQGNRRDAMRWSRNWLGIESREGHHLPIVRRPVPRRDATQDVDRDAQRRRAQARQIWHGTQADISGTPVEYYLANRGIDLQDLGRMPGSLRFAPHLWCTEVRRPLPAMIAAICGGNGKLIAVHRTWLAQNPEGIWTKAPLQFPKKVLGGSVGGVIRLWRGASGKALGVAPEGESIVLAEGIETGLSIAIACPERRVLCAVSLSNIGRVILPDTINEIIVAADNDGGNETAGNALAAACRKLSEQGRRVRVAMPEHIGTDWNDVLREDQTTIARS